MSMLRDGIALIGALGLAGGYAASQRAALVSGPAEYTRQSDQPAVRWLALGLLAVLVVLALIPAKEEAS